MKFPFMEVHHHAHTERKKWTHYFWEFLMLFLAVFCGFLAENQREHYVEHKREKQFIRSICEDLKSDTSQLNRLTNHRKKISTKIDSLLYYLNMPEPDKYGKFIYYYARPITAHLAFLSNDRTIQQLKNAGNLRLIRNQEVSDSIMRYDFEIRRNAIRIERQEDFIMDYIEIIKQLFDGSEFDKMLIKTPYPSLIDWSWPKDDLHLLHKDKVSIQKLMNSLHFIKSINVFNIGWNEYMINRASELLAFLKKEYHLK
jgi:hypothetical protein